MAFDDIPAGAIRAMVRSPATDAVPRGPMIQRVQQSPYMQQQMAMPSVPPQLPQPNWKMNDEWSNLTKRAVDTLGKFGKTGDDTIKNIDDALADLKNRNSELATALGKLGSARTAPYLNSATNYGGYFGGDAGDYDQYLKGIRGNESGNDDSAVNTSTGATGRYQFMPSTARSLMAEHPELGLKMEDVNKPEVQEALMKLYTDKSVATLTPLLGRKPTMGELYMLHFLGHAGGPQVLSNLNAPIEETTRKIDRDYNPVMFKGVKTGRDLLARLESKFGG